MKQTTTTIIAILLLWCCGLSVYAQSITKNTSGKQFHFTYLANFNDVYRATLQLKVVVEKACYITTRYNATGTYWNGWDNTWVFPGIYTFEVPNDNVINNPSANTGISSFKTITLMSSENVCVYAINHSNLSTDATGILPVPAWGTEYRLATGIPVPSASNSLSALYAVVANENGTVVTLHNGTNITLDEGEVYHFTGAAEEDMTGLRITANKPIGVFSGNGGTAGPGQFGSVCIPSNFPGRVTADHTYEQLWSVDKWSTEFLAFPIATPGSGSIPTGNNWGGMLAVVARENVTNITLSGGIVGTPLNNILHAGDYWYTCTYMTGLTKIVSDKPIMVFLILPDATVTTILPTNQQIQHTLVSPFILSSNSNIDQHGIDILVPAAHWNQMIIKHNGADSTASYTPTPNTHFPEWYHIRKDLPNVDADIEITCPNGFLAYLSGSGHAESYTFSVGGFPLQNYFTIQEKETLIDTYYYNTAEITHTFELTDTIIVKRTVELPFDSISWLMNGEPVLITENTNNTNTLEFSALTLLPGKNTISMLIHSGTTIDTLTGNVWWKPRKEFTIQEKDTTIDTPHENTERTTHTFELTDTIIVKRTVEFPFDSISWLINNIPYSIPENVNHTNTLDFPASALLQGENTISMLIHSGTTINTLTGIVWREITKGFTIQEKHTTIDTYYANTKKSTHTFDSIDIIIVKRIVPLPFDSISWLINGEPYPIMENTNHTNTLNFPALALSPCENTISMLIHSGGIIDTLIGNVWLQFLIRGTMFPFVHTDWDEPEYDRVFNALFPVTASLYELPPFGKDDPIEEIHKSAPIETVRAVYYDGSTYVPGTPKYPGIIGRTNQPGVPINWSRINKQQDTTTNYTPVTGIGDIPIGSHAVGMFTFEDAVIGKDYILYLHRPGHLARYARVTITYGGTLGHRFLIPGDLNGNGKIDSQDISLLNSNFSAYGRPGYNPDFDLDANARVESHDGSLINRFYLNSTQNIYSDTFDWIIEYYLQPSP